MSQLRLPGVFTCSGTPLPPLPTVAAAQRVGPPLDVAEGSALARCTGTIIRCRA